MKRSEQYEQFRKKLIRMNRRYDLRMNRRYNLWTGFWQSFNRGQKWISKKWKWGVLIGIISFLGICTWFYTMIPGPFWSKDIYAKGVLLSTDSMPPFSKTRYDIKRKNNTIKIYAFHYTTWKTFKITINKHNKGKAELPKIITGQKRRKLIEKFKRYESGDLP